MNKLQVVRLLNEKERECVNLLELVRRLEWSGKTRGPGSGFMASGGDGYLSESCPVCRGIRPGDPHELSYIEEAIGHKKECEIRIVLNSNIGV